MCSQTSDCLMISFKINECKLYNQVKYSVQLSLNSDPCLFEKVIPNYSSINAYLTNYWPFNNNLNDVISGLNLYGGSGGSFTSDRLNQQSSALLLNPGYLLFPPSIYFKGDMTISVWVKPNSVIGFARVIDCGNGASLNNLILSLKGQSGPYICSCNTGCVNIHSVKQLQVGKWYHFAYTIEGTLAKLYVNGNIWAQGTQGSPISVTRSKCYLGRSNWNADPQSIYALVDDLKFFNKSLTETEVKKVMNNYY
jgi:hypothetical protein